MLRRGVASSGDGARRATLRRSAFSTIVAFALLLAPAVAGLARDLPPRHARVTTIVDGDTIRVDLDHHLTTIRLIGVDTPELSPRNRPSVPAQPFAHEAAAFARRTLVGRRVRLEFESADRIDKYGRTLAYVFLPNGTFFNRELVRQGYGRAYVVFPFRFRKQFLADEAVARRERRGLWAQ